MDHFFPFTEMMQYAIVRGNQNTDILTTTAGGIVENHLLEEETNAAEPSIFCAATGSLWPYSASEQSYPAETTLSSMVGSPMSMDSTGSFVHDEGNTNLSITERNLYVASVDLTESVRVKSAKSTRANNLTGRIGKLLCSQCREWRIKVQNTTRFKADY
jgi:hypothetical protein